MEPKQQAPDLSLSEDEIIEKFAEGMKGLDVTLADVLAGRLDFLDEKSGEADK